MKLAIINPNSTQSMTQKCHDVASSIVYDQTEIWSSNPTTTPASIEGQYDEAMSVSGLLDEVKKAKEWGAEGLVVACFDDPGLGACRELMDGPVMGICEGAMHTASIIANGFSVVTTLPRSTPIIRELAHKYGFDKFCHNVRAADIPVLDLEHNPDIAYQKLKHEIMEAIKHDHAEAIILGCAGMTGLTDKLSDECGVPIIDGVTVTVKLVEALLYANIKTSKINGYALPRFNK